MSKESDSYTLWVASGDAITHYARQCQLVCGCARCGDGAELARLRALGAAAKLTHDREGNQLIDAYVARA